jgi:hypothetical protein
MLKVLSQHLAHQVGGAYVFISTYGAVAWQCYDIRTTVVLVVFKLRLHFHARVPPNIPSLFHYMGI